MLKKFFYNLIVPQVRCPICNQLTVQLVKTGICQTCADSLVKPFAPFCDRCHKPFATDRYAASVDQENPSLLVCADCVRSKSSGTTIHRYQRSSWLYNQSAQNLIFLYKYGGKRSIATPLARMLYLTYQEYYSDCQIDFITAIPLHQGRLIERSFNQSELIATQLSKLTGIPYLTALIKVKATEKLSKQVRANRFIQTEHSFQVNPAESARLANKRLLIIDDIYTTGATAEHAGSTLINSVGVATVYVLTVARAYDQEILS